MIKNYKQKKIETKKFNLKKRESRVKRGYDSRWYAYRKRFLKHNSKCYVCLSEDRINIDHIIAHKGNVELFWNANNYMSLCHSCHSIATSKFDKFNPPLTEEKIKWIRKQREQNKVDITVKIVPI